MPKSIVATEASRCRALAREFKGRPEQPFLLRLADEFEEVGRADLNGFAAGVVSAEPRRQPPARRHQLTLGLGSQS